jgi:hypothetical protein
LPGTVAPFRELRFNGDQEAFENANFRDYIASMGSGNVLWMNRNMVIFKEQMADDFASSIHQMLEHLFQWLIQVRFDAICFYVCYRNEPGVLDVPKFDLLLDSVGQLSIRELRICSLFYRIEAQLFSTEALRLLLTRNHRLKFLELMELVIADDACKIIGELSSLNSLQILDCDFNLQIFVDEVGANVFGPKSIKLDYDDTNISTPPDFSSLIALLLKNQRLTKLHLDPIPPRIGNIEATKAAFKSSHSLQELCIGSRNPLADFVELKSLMEAIVAAPAQSWLHLEFDGLKISASPQPSQIIANALKKSEDNRLECISLKYFGRRQRPDKIWKREVVPILKFNYERRRFRESAHETTYTRTELLARAF